jgi:murein DD-endopeptidase MepM/ murein hydrolase activator NlpD
MYTFNKNDVDKIMSKKRSSAKVVKYITGFLAGTIAVSVITLGSQFLHKPNAYVLEINKKPIALVKNKADVENALATIFTEPKGYDQVSYAEKISYKPIRESNKHILKADEIGPVLKRNITLTAKASLVTVNGKVICIANNQEIVRNILGNLKQKYTPQETEKMKLKGVDFKESVALKTEDVPINRISDKERVKSLLMNEEKPLIHVVATLKTINKETLPFPVEIRKDRDMWRGTEKVKQQGVNGEQEVSYKVIQINGQKILAQKADVNVTKEPVPKIVVKGTSLALASRSGGGFLSWPLFGSITSPFGSRWGSEFHTGIDINGDTGDPVRAIEDGTVTYAGYNGNYGNMVAINHGDGLVTRYAHNSKLAVKDGEKVKKGEIISYVGSTGRSTGSHLHFEVIVNGDFKNPRKYLK